MNAEQLIEMLSKVPPKAKVLAVWDGAARSQIDRVWVAREGHVCLSHEGQTIYYDSDRPVDAPDCKTDRYWTIGNKDEDD